MSESLPVNDPGTQKRRSTRIVQAVPITVSGVDALGQPFKERTTTVMVNCHGCKYQSKHYVPKNSIVTLEIPRMEPAFPPRVVPGHVVWVQRPRTVRELFQIGLEFEIAANVWGIAFPPEDWVACADEPATALSTPSEVEAPFLDTETPEISTLLGSQPEQPVNQLEAMPAPAPAAKPPIPPPPRSTAPTQLPAAKAVAPSVKPPTSSPTPAALSVPGESKVHVMPSPPAAAQDSQLAVARQMAKIVAEAKETLDKTLRRGAQTAINEEMTIVRQQLDAQMHDTIEHAIKSSMERVSESEVKRVVQQAANKTAAIVEGARLASEANAQKIDEKVRQAVQERVGQATELAAKHAVEQAAQNAVVLNLKQTVDEAVAEAIGIRDASVPQVDEKQIDEKVRQAVQQTVGHATEQAAREAALQASSQNLKQSVENLVGRVIAEREANMPSLEVLMSPDAAQRHLDEWKKNLEQTAQQVQIQAVEQSQAEAEKASRLWHEELEAMLAGSSATMGERLSEVSHTAIANTEKEIASQQLGLRALLADAISGAEQSIQSLGAGIEQQRAHAERARAQLEETVNTTVEQARKHIDDLAAVQQEAASKKANEVISATAATVESLGARLEQERLRAEETRSQIEETAKATLEQTRQRLDEMSAAEQQAIGRKATELIAERMQHIEPFLHNSAQKVMEHFSGELEQRLSPRLEEAHRAVAELKRTEQQATDFGNSVRSQVEHASNHALQIQDAMHERLQQVSEAAVRNAVSELAHTREEANQLQDQLKQGLQQRAEQISQLRDVARDQLQQEAQAVIDKTTAEFGNARREVVLLQSQIHQGLRQATEHVTELQDAARERVQRETQALVEKAVAELAFAGQEAAQLQDTIREQAQKAWELVDQVGGAALEKVQITSAEVVQRAVVHLADAQQQASRLQEDIHLQVQIASAQVAEAESRLRERIEQASEKTVQQTVERLRTETAKYPAEFEEACRTRIARVEEELDQKSSDMQHSAYDALLKSSEWYQKKAQTTMQSTMERVIEQSSSTMREKAGEVSGMVASELDHYRRSYVEHGRGEIEEAAKEVLERERARLSETGEIANATFTDRVQHVTAESLRRFQEVSREALEKSRSDLEFNREGSLAEFQKTLDEKMMQGVEQASTYLQSQLVPLLESWEAKREAEKREWMEHIKASSEQSMEAYKARLENATNSWLLASAATLGQNSQAVLDSLAKTAEKRMRETCSQVLAGMGDTLKERLLGISSALNTEGNEKEG